MSFLFIYCLLKIIFRFKIRWDFAVANDQSGHIHWQEMEMEIWTQFSMFVFILNPGLSSFFSSESPGNV